MSSAAQVTVTPLPAEGILPADATLALAIDRICARPHRIFLVRSGADRRAVPERDLRAAWHDHAPRDTRVWELARAQLVAPGLEAARSALADQESLDSMVAVGASNHPTCVSRELISPKIAIVMAGGLGTRLRPLTDNLPKPLLPIGGEPLLGRILKHLQRHGVLRVFLSVHYLAEKVRHFVGDGSRFELEVEYLEEKQPLGTGAGLALMPRVDGPFLVVNGDVLTNVNLSALGRCHALDKNLVTVATCLLPTQLKYGVVHSDGDRIVGIEEKPTLLHPMNAGIYAFAPEILDRVQQGVPLPMVPFVNTLIEKGERVGRFALVEYWNDIGAHADYESAQAEIGRLFPANA